MTILDSWRRLVWCVAATTCMACGSIEEVAQSGSRFVSESYGFEIAVGDSLDRAGWFIVRERDAALTHLYTPPDSSSWTPVAVIVPPGASFPALAPFNVDVFELKDPSLSAGALAELRSFQVGDDVISRASKTVNGQDAAEVIYGQGNSVAYETFLTRRGIGFSVNALGAPDVSNVPRQFVVDSGAYRAVVNQFRFLD